MSALDGGSAAPPTADVPTGDRATDLRTPARWLNDPEFAGIEILDYDGWRGADWRTPVTVQEFRRRLWLCTITGPVRRSADHSGVAGEPEATTKEASESAQDSGPTPTHAPTPETPGAVNVAGGAAVPDEAVEALVRHLSEETLPAAWRTDDRWERCKGGAVEAWGPKARAYLTAAAPLVVRDALAGVADRLRAASAGRAEYASQIPDGSGRELLEAEARVLRLAAEVVLGDDGPLYGWLPSWRWTDEMTARLATARKATDLA